MTENTQPTSNAEQPKTYVKLLKDLGPQLPVGFLDGRSLSKEMDHKPWKLKQERELGELREKHRDANVAQYVSMVLGTMYKQLGSLGLHDMSLSDKRGKIGRMFMGDVFYAYLWLRTQAMGNVFEAKVTCPHCSYKFLLPADLNTVEVTCADEVDAVQWQYKLLDPFDVQGQRITYFEMGPAKWRTLEGAEIASGLNTGAAKALIIRGSIWKTPEMTKGALGDADLDELSKRDLEAITKGIDDHGIGPDMSIEERCPRCRADFKIAIDWGYDSFFGASSR